MVEPIFPFVLQNGRTGTSGFLNLKYLIATDSSTQATQLLIP